MPSFTRTTFEYVIPATGVLTIDQSLNNVKMFPVNDLSYADLFGTLQLNVDKSLFHIDSTLDPATANFVTDSVNVTASNILDKLINVQSVGYLSTMYENYNNYVNAYFGNTTGFSVTFTTDMSGNKYSNGFEDSTFTETDAETLLRSHLTGNLTLSGLTELLRYICLEDPFNNRKDYGLYEYTNGFIPGDLVFFKAGINITLHTEIDNSGILIYSQNISSFQDIDNSFNSRVIIDPSGTLQETLTNTDLSGTEIITSSSPAPDNVKPGMTYTFNSPYPVYNNKSLQMSVNIPVLLILN